MLLNYPILIHKKEKDPTKTPTVCRNSYPANERGRRSPPALPTLSGFVESLYLTSVLFLENLRVYYIIQCKIQRQIVARIEEEKQIVVASYVETAIPTTGGEEAKIPAKKVGEMWE